MSFFNFERICLILVLLTAAGMIFVPRFNKTETPSKQAAPSVDPSADRDWEAEVQASSEDRFPELLREALAVRDGQLGTDRARLLVSHWVELDPEGLELYRLRWVNAPLTGSAEGDAIILAHHDFFLSTAFQTAFGEKRPEFPAVAPPAVVPLEVDPRESPEGFERVMQAVSDP